MPDYKFTDEPLNYHSEIEKEIYLRKPKVSSSKDHLAGTQAISVADAETITVTDLINQLGISSMKELVDNYRLGIWEHIDSIDTVFSRAGIDLSTIPQHFVECCGIPISRKEATRHLLVCGTTGSGKTTLIRFLMLTALRFIGNNRNTRAIIYDPKREVASFLYTIFDLRFEEGNREKSEDIIKILNPFDARCVAWDVCKDIRTKTEAKTFASIVIPDDSSDNQFFPKSARLILADIIYSFILHGEEIEEENEGKPDEQRKPIPEWSLRDICVAFHSVFHSLFKDNIKNVNTNALADSSLAEIILERHPLTQRTISFIKREQNQSGGNDVLLTVLSYIDDLEAIAAAWDNRPKISFRDWYKDESGQVLILGSSSENEDALTAINSAMVQFIGTIIGDSKDTHSEYIKPFLRGRKDVAVLPTPDEEKALQKKQDNKFPSRTWIFLDEFPDLKIKNIERFLTKGRSKGVCAVLSFQDFASIQENYREYLAEVIASCCNFKIFLQSDGKAAEWISSNIGKERKTEEKHSDTTGTAIAKQSGTGTAEGSSSGTNVPDGFWENAPRTRSNSTQFTFNTSQSTTVTDSHSHTVTIDIVERDVVMYGDIVGLRGASEEYGLEGYAKSSLLPGKIWKFHYSGSSLRILKQIQEKAKEDEIEDFINRLETEGTKFLKLRLFNEADFERLGLDFKKYAKRFRKQQRRFSDAELKEFIETIKWRKGYMTGDEKEDYALLDDWERNLFNQHLQEFRMIEALQRKEKEFLLEDITNRNKEMTLTMLPSEDEDE